MAPLVLKVKNDHAPFSSFSQVECEDDITQAWRVIHKVSNALEHGSRLENLSWRLWFRHQLMNRNGTHGHFTGLKENTAHVLDRGGFDLESIGKQFWYGHEPKKKPAKMKKKQVVRPPPLSQPSTQYHQQQHQQQHQHHHVHSNQTQHPNMHTPTMMMHHQQQQPHQPLSPSAPLMMQQSSEMNIDELLSHPARSLQHDHGTPEWAQTEQTSQRHPQSHLQQEQQHSSRSAAFDTASILAESAQSLQAALSMDFEDHGAASLLDQQNMLVDRMASFSVTSPLSPTSRQTHPESNALYMTTGGSMPPPPSATLGNKLYDHQQPLHHHQQLPHATSYNSTAESSHMMTSYSASMQHSYTPRQQEHHQTPGDETIPVQQQHIMSLLAEAGMFDGDPKQLHSTPPPQTAPNTMASSRNIQRIGVGYEDTDPRLKSSASEVLSDDDDDDSTDDDSDDDTSSDSDSDASSDDTPICTNCGATSTPLWRRSNEDELLCNACGLYQKLHNAPRPKSLRPNNPRKETREDLTPKITCSNCGTNNTPLWRRDGEGAPLCNACGLYYKLHQEKRPLSMKTDTIKKRQRYEGSSGKKKKKKKKSKKSGSEEKHKKKKKRQKRIQEDHVDVSYSPTQPRASVSSSSNTTMAPMAVTPSSSSSLLSNHPHHPQHHHHHHHPSPAQQSPQPSPSSSTYALHQSPVSHTPPVSNFVTSATQLMLNFQAATSNPAEVTPDFFQYQDYFGSNNFCPYFPDATSSSSGQSTPHQPQPHNQQQ